MADKAISELTAAEQIKSTDMFVLEQDGTAKRLQGQTLLNWLTAAADGHGGIKSIAKTGTSGLVDTYTITLADTTAQTFTVTNGNGLTKFEKTGTEGLVDTYRFTRSDGTYFTFAVANGAKGDTGEASHVWIKYASQQPTAASHSMGDVPDDWMGVYAGTAESAPTDWQAYTWYQIKGEKGDTGAPATVSGTAVEYMVSDSGTVVPSGSWSTTIPTVPQGKYLWTRVTTTFNTGSPVVSYSVTRMGIDGTGSVSTVNSQSPDENGNVALTAADIQTDGNESVQAALDAKQSTLTPGQNIAISGNTIGTKAFPCNPNPLDNWYFGNPVNQRGQTEYTGEGYCIDRWKMLSHPVSVQSGGIKITCSSAASYSYALQQLLENLEEGAQYTISALITENTTTTGFGFRIGSKASSAFRGTGLFSWTATADSTAGTQGFGVHFNSRADDNGKYIKIKAIKLELGDTQTLAHQDANGNWVLNEIPDYGEQLLRCQRFFQVLDQYGAYAAVADGNGNLLVPIYLKPNMRVRPSITFESTATRGIAYFTDGTNKNAASTPAVGGSVRFLNLNFTSIGKTNMGAIFRLSLKATLSADL